MFAYPLYCKYLLMVLEFQKIVFIDSGTCQMTILMISTVVFLL